MVEIHIFADSCDIDSSSIDLDRLLKNSITAAIAVLYDFLLKKSVETLSIVSLCLIKILLSLSFEAS